MLEVQQPHKPPKQKPLQMMQKQKLVRLLLLQAKVVVPWPACLRPLPKHLLSRQSPSLNQNEKQKKKKLLRKQPLKRKPPKLFKTYLKRKNQVGGLFKTMSGDKTKIRRRGLKMPIIFYKE